MRVLTWKAYCYFFLKICAFMISKDFSSYFQNFSRQLVQSNSHLQAAFTSSPFIYPALKNLIMEDCAWVEVKLPIILRLFSRQRWVFKFTFQSLYALQGDRGVHLPWGHILPKAILYRMAKRTSLSVINLVASPFSVWATFRSSFPEKSILILHLHQHLRLVSCLFPQGFSKTFCY
jgi:hypothetical protein